MSEEERQQKSSGAGQHVKHRRKKNEIEKEFICGDSNCGRRYGTNAALYTHIKNKHGGVPPAGTVKPSTSKKKSSPERQSIEPDNEFTQNVETLNDQDFQKFALMISSLGKLEERNIIVRDEEEQVTLLEQQKLQDLYNSILEVNSRSSNNNNVGNTCFTKKAENYLKFSSSCWKSGIINELYTYLIFAYIWRGEKFDELYQDIQKRYEKYPLFGELIKNNKSEQVKLVYETIWKFIN